MVLFLKIVGAFLVALALLAALAFWWFKRWIRRKVGEFETSFSLLDPRLGRPARIRLERSSCHELGEPLQALWMQYHALGFRLQGDYAERNGAFSHVRFASHPELRLGLTLIEDPDEQVAGTVWAMSEDKRLEARGNGQETELRSGSVHWIVSESLSADQCFEGMREAVTGKTLCVPDSRLFRSVWERMYALRADAEIAAGAPTRQQVADRIQSIAPDGEENAIDSVYDISLSQWRSRMEEAVLDHWRRASRLDAVSWARLENDIHVVDASVNVEGIIEKLNDYDHAETLVRQLHGQGFENIRLYEEAQKRLPSACRYKRVGEVRRPVQAVIYAREEDENENGDKGALPHAYLAFDREGREVSGSIFAVDRTDAHRQLQGMGLSEIRILTEPAPGGDVAEVLFDDKTAAMAVRGMQDSVAVSFARALLANVWIWLPPLVLLGFSWRSTSPAGWSDWFIYAYAVVALGAMIVVVSPMLFFHQTLRSIVFGRWGRALFLLSMLEKVNLLKMLKPVQILAMRCKILAGSGHVREALKRWKTQEGKIDAEVFYGELVQIYDAAGETDKHIDALRHLQRISSVSYMPTIDLAMSLVRYRRSADEAESLIGRLSSIHLPEPSQGGYHYVRGLILAERSQHRMALNQYKQAIEKIEPFAKSTPIVLGLLAEINGYSALSLKACEKQDVADELWQSVLPILRLHASTRPLVERYEKTGTGEAAGI